MVVVALGVGLAVGFLRHRVSVASPGRTYATAAGQRLTVTLVDGTRMTLGPESRARVGSLGGPVAAGGSVTTDPYYSTGQVLGGAREVELEGEAYFAVVHDAAHPFAVLAHGAVARDVGTAFDVRSYPEDAGARITVAEGVVAVRAATTCPTSMLVPGQRGVRTVRNGPIRNDPARVADGAPSAADAAGWATGGGCSASAQAGDVATVGQGRVAVEHRGDVSAYVAWMQGRLVFEATPLPEVVHELERTFDLEITIRDTSLVRQTLTASFGNEGANEVLDAITDAIGARYDRVGRRVTLRQRTSVGNRHVPDAARPLVHTAQATVPEE